MLKLFFAMLVRVFLTFIKVGFVTLNQKKSTYIIWAPNFFSLHFLVSDNFQRVMFSYFHLKTLGESVTIYTKWDIGRFTERKIFYFGGEFYNTFGFDNYVRPILYIARQLEAQGNLIVPSSCELELWENKATMHDLFTRLNIRTPQTQILTLEQFDNLDSQDFPFLIKEEHSCSSRGVYKISSNEDLMELRENESFRRLNERIIVQKLLDIRRDLRVILIGDEIVLHYWRINPSEVWRPTSTGRGSLVDFENFPDYWRDWIISSFKKLGMTTGAFDIAWDGDDMNTEPYILEVSPFYQPNPKPQLIRNYIQYGNWKNSLVFRDNYQRAFVKVVCDLQGRIVRTVLGNV